MWERTALWRRLVETTSDADPLRSQVLSVMPRIETLLRDGGTAPRQFTLHDADHSRRVAERIAEIVPAATWERLSPSELALLLLGAYLHDIGMTPAHGRVAAYHALLVDGSDGALSAPDRAAFQAWLDRMAPGTELATEPRVMTTAELRRIDALTAHYVRDRHVEWGEAWIREHLSFEVAGQPTFQEDLIALCRSHHEGYDDLLERRFDPRFTTRGVVHLRYLAAVLRIADVLEVDPERTPEIVFRHRDIDGDSVVHWHKDHEVQITLERGERVIAEAAPQSATMHRAIEETVDQIELELRLVQSLAAEKPFGIAPPRKQPLPYEWRLEPIVYRRVQPKNDAYEYVDGGFRPNTDKLLELLGGIALYQSRLAAVRELLQNAFDAVRERIGWQQLAHGDDSRMLDALLRRHEVALELLEDERGMWLVCSDSGAGMTKEIITKRLLVSGSGSSAELLQLRRELAERDITLERTGRFGIGVLSYFMLGERVEIETCRCDEAHTRDGTGWAFSTEGVGSFGELRRIARAEPGTRVAIRADAFAEDGIEAAWERLAGYFDDLLVRLPCALRLSAPALGAERAFAAGWIHNRGRLTEQLGRPDWPGQRRAAALPKVRRWLRWIELDEELPDGLGRFHAALPYYETPHGVALAAMDLVAQKGRDGLLVRVQDAIPNWTTASESWHGMRLADPPKRANLVRIDWQSDAAGQLSVNRAELLATAAAKQAKQHVDHRVGEALAALVEQHRDSRFTPANARLLPATSPPARTFDDGAWLVYEPSGGERSAQRWRRLSGPLVEREDGLFRTRKVLAGGRPAMSLASVRGSHRHIEWGDREWPPDRLLIDRELDRFAFCWEQPRPSRRSLDGRHPATELPPELAHIASIHTANRFAFNAAHPLVRTVSSAPGVWRTQCEHDPGQPLDTAQLTSPAVAAAWLLWFLVAPHQLWIVDVDDLWDELHTERPEVWTRMWELAWSDEAAAGKTVIDLSLEDGSEGHVYLAHTLTARSHDYETIVPYRLFKESCAGAADEWLLTEQR
jgi:Histidine kinase-, DNA gyrase B-, and HSP90-like ATPase